MKIDASSELPAPGALVASFVFVDLVGFSKKSTTDQCAEKAILTGMLKASLCSIPQAAYIIKDTGDGAWIGFAADPEHALFVVLSLVAACRPLAPQSALSRSDFRIGLNLGTVKRTLDLESRLNYIGDGINVAQRVMDFARPGQITASRSYYEAVVWLHSGFPHLFTHIPAGRDKHGREHDLYAIEPDLDVLQELRRGLATASVEPGSPLKQRHSPTRWVAVAALAISVAVGAAILVGAWLPAREPMAASSGSETAAQTVAAPRSQPPASAMPAATNATPAVSRRDASDQAAKSTAAGAAPDPVSDGARAAKPESNATEPSKSAEVVVDGKSAPPVAVTQTRKTGEQASVAGEPRTSSTPRTRPFTDPDLDLGHDDELPMISAPLPARGTVPRTFTQTVPRQGGRRSDASLTPDGTIRLPGDRRPERDGRGRPPGPPAAGGDPQVR